MIVLLFGPPGCGKGTQAAFIARRFNIPAISTGEVFRAEVKAGTPLGKAALAIMEAGGLVGDDVVNPMVANRISQPDCAGGFLLDGYPRTMPQAEFLEAALRDQHREQPIAIYLDVPAEVLVSRITSRRQCPQCGKIYNLLSLPPKREGLCDIDGTPLIQRADDTEAVIRERLKAYDAQTGPVIDHYMRRGGIRIDGNHPVDEIWKQIESVLKKKSGDGPG